MYIEKAQWKTLYQEDFSGDVRNKSLMYIDQRLQGEEKTSEIALKCLKDLYMIAHIEKNAELLSETNRLRKIFNLTDHKLIDVETFTWMSEFGYETNWLYSAVYYHLLFNETDFADKFTEAKIPQEILKTTKEALENVFKDIIFGKEVHFSLNAYRSVQICHFILMKHLSKKIMYDDDGIFYEGMIEQAYIALLEDSEWYYQAIKNLSPFCEDRLGRKIERLKESFSFDQRDDISHLSDVYFRHCITNSYYSCSFLIDQTHKRDIDLICKNGGNNASSILFELRKKIQKIYDETSNADVLEHRLMYAKEKILELNSLAPKASYRITQFARILKSRALTQDEIEGIVAEIHSSDILSFFSLDCDSMSGDQFESFTKRYNLIYNFLRSQILHFETEIGEEKFLINNLFSLAEEALKASDYHLTHCLYSVLDHYDIRRIPRLDKMISDRIEKFSEMFKANERFRNYKSALKKSPIPPIPFMAIVSGNLIRVRESKDMQSLDEIIVDLKKRKIAIKAAYPYLLQPVIEDFFSKPPHIEQAIWVKSDIDEKANAYSDIKRGKERSKTI